MTDRRRGLWRLAAALVASALVLGAWERAVGGLPLEGLLVDALFGTATTPLVWETTNFFLGFGATLVVVLTLAVACWIVGRADGPRVAVLVVAAAGAAVLATAAKTVLGPTPIFAGTQEEVPSGGNFPSGHAAYTAAVFGVLAALALRRGRGDLAGLAGLLVLLVGVSSVVAGAHVPSDVLGGWLLGGAWALAVLLVGLPWATATPAPGPAPERTT